MYFLLLLIDRVLIKGIINELGNLRERHENE